MKSPVLAIGGEPCTGKTTLMRAVLKALPGSRRTIALQTAVGHLCGSVLVLGRYDKPGTFAGTDRLSMAVQPRALDLIGWHQGPVIFEGDRLFNSSFFFTLRAAGHPVDLVRLVVPEPTLARRHRDRQDTQTEKFLRSRRTKLDNIDAHDTMRREEHVTPSDTQRLVCWVLAWAAHRTAAA